MTAAFPLPASLVPLVTTLVNDSNAALAQGNGSVTAFTVDQIAAILADAAAVEAAAAPYIAGTDAMTAYPALVASDSAMVATLAMSLPATTITEVVVTNPDLFALAAEYYGDATQWQAIGSANGLTDPMPVGQFTLIIPPLGTGQLPAPVPAQQPVPTPTPPAPASSSESNRVVPINLGNVSGNVALGATGTAVYLMTLVGNVTLSMVGPTPPDYTAILVYATQGGEGSYTITYPSNFLFQGGYSTALSTAVGAMDVLQTTSVNSGSTWTAAIVLQAPPPA